MNDVARSTLWRDSLAMAAGIFAGVLAWVSIDVALAEARIDPSDPSTWPNMGPAIRLFIVPELAVFLLLLAFIVNPVFGIFGKLTRPMHWAMLGLAYSLPALSLALGHSGIGQRMALVVTSICSILAAWGVVRSFGWR